jgi:hypothetical protein
MLPIYLRTRNDIARWAAELPIYKSDQQQSCPSYAATGYAAGSRTRTITIYPAVLTLFG